MFKPDVATTVKVTPVTPAIDALSVKQVWEGTGLPDRSDKSKMLAYLRGMNAATKISGAAYDESRHRVVEKKSDIHKQNIKNPVVDTFKGSDHEVSWGNANPATLPTILQLEPEKEPDSDTCFWRGQQALEASSLDDDAYRSRLVQDTANITSKAKEHKPHNVTVKIPEDPTIPDITKKTDEKKTKKPKKSEAASQFENLGENVIKFYECLKKKFFISCDKMRVKICAMFG
ncbi:uncharacterized protein LOC125234931 [Leguminivora glycinivorella]|uniref:uncharacterized protein LOC125234931 n=1 Tax=Leguminivora glycinivorella TaxID=1035111 RepID=UPI00200EB66F|nr:uncharacterized protein LOC125234931 [Leguminivora glycinivorella]